MSTIPTGTYTIDPGHSNIGFEVKHLGIATVRGAFKNFEGTIEATDANLTVNGTVEVASVDTGQSDRDGHLQSPDFFDVAQFPQISFSASSADVSGEDVTIDGQLTIRGVTKPVKLTGEFANIGEDPWGNQRVGFDVGTSIDRGEFGLSFDATAPGGNLVVSKKVKLVISASAVKAA